MTTRFRRALDALTRVKGVQGAMLVAGDDGLVVAESLMEGMRGNAVAALAASVVKRFRRATGAAGLGLPQFYHLQTSHGTVLVVPAPDGVLVVTLGEANLNVGLARLEMLRAAEAIVA